MGNEVQVQKTAGGLTFKLPPHLVEKMKLLAGGNLGSGGVGVNQLLIESKKWTANVGGEKKTFMRPVIVQNADGTYGPDPSGADEPRPTLTVIVLEPGLRGRIFYDGPYAENNRRGPDCWSEDGKKPSSSIEKPVFASCGMCPKAAEGSAATAAYPKARACGEYKRLAVQVCSQRGIEWGIPPLSLKLSISSIWDMRDELSMAEGWYAWDNYVKFLKANGCAHSAAVITQMRFNPNATLQVQFKLIGFTESADFDKLAEMAATDEVRKLLPVISGSTVKADAPKGKPLPEDDEPTPEQIAANARAAAQQQAVADAAAKEAAATAKAETDRKMAERAAKAAIKKAEADAKAAAEKAAAEAQAKAAAKAKADEDAGAWDEPAAPAAKQEVLPPLKAGESAMPARNVTPKATVTTAAVVEVPAALAGILGDWGE